MQAICPIIDDNNTIWVADNASIIGKVLLKEKSSIWFGSVLRGDNELITIGKQTNVQELSVFHTDLGVPVSIGDNCTIGHRALIHGCTIGNNCLIGMGAIVMNHAVISHNSIVGAGSLVTEGKIFPERSLIYGNPAQFIRYLRDEEITKVEQISINYHEKAMRFKVALHELSK